MYLVEIFLPVADNAGQAFPRSHYSDLLSRLSETFGGATAFNRTPAEGLWREGHETIHDDIVIFEVMCETLDLQWWTALRSELENLFRQDRILIRCMGVQRI